MLTKIIDIRGSMLNAALYVKETSDNESITTLYGDELEVGHIANDTAHMFPTKRKTKRSDVVGQMVIVSPAHDEKPLTAEQELQLLEDIKTEYNTGSRAVSLTKHTKHDGTSHYHFLIPDRDEAGRRLRVNNSFKRNEKLSRKWEVEFNHQINKGRHNKAVVENLSINGNDDIAEQLQAAEIDKGELPKAAFSKGLQGKAKRLGIDLPLLHRALIDGTKDKNRLLENLSNELGQLGLVISPGKKAGHLIIENTDGEFLGGLDRIAKITSEEMKELRKEIENEHSTKHISEYRKERNRTDGKEPDNREDKHSNERVIEPQQEVQYSQDSNTELEGRKHKEHPEPNTTRQSDWNHHVDVGTTSRGRDAARRGSDGRTSSDIGEPSKSSSIFGQQIERNRSQLVKVRDLVKQILKEPHHLRRILEHFKKKEEYDKQMKGAIYYKPMLDDIANSKPIDPSQIRTPKIEPEEDYQPPSMGM